MAQIKNLMEDLAIEALEARTNIAGVAVISETGDLLYQTSNFDVSKEIKVIMSVLNGANSYTLNKLQFSVTETNQEGIIATNTGGMGHCIFATFKGGVLVAYAMPQADTTKALSFLRPYALKLERMI